MLKVKVTGADAELFITALREMTAEIDQKCGVDLTWAEVNFINRVTPVIDVLVNGVNYTVEFMSD